MTRTAAHRADHPRFAHVSHRVEVLGPLTGDNRDRGTTIVMVLHDLDPTSGRHHTRVPTP
nr:hypothetical protein [Jiangella endophytica]